MGFRDSFIDGYLLTPVGPRQRTFAQWSLESTVDSGLRANQRQVQALREGLTSAFQAGIAQLERSQAQSARLLQRELQYQADHIVDAIDRASADVVSAVQKGCDYLGGQLCEVRWAIERQSQVSQQILQVLLNDLDNTARQYWEQGVKCYESAEYDLARERFRRALDASRTNHFAYQYLGLIAVREGKADEAIRNFELARKFAESGYHRALALSHLARSYYATGKMAQAAQSSLAATEASPEHAKFWYEAAVYLARSADSAEALRCLRRAIQTDWMYWSIAIADANLGPIRDRVEGLLAELREEARVVARRRLDHLAATVALLREISIPTVSAAAERSLAESEASYRAGTVFAYRDLVQPALAAERAVLDAALKALDQRVWANRSSLAKLRAQQAEEVGRAHNRIQQAESAARLKQNTYVSHGGCLIALGILGGGFSGFWYFIGLSDYPDRPMTQVFGTGFMVCLVLLVTGLFWRPIAKLVTVTLPARAIRAQIPSLQRDLERVKEESEVRVAQARSDLDREHEQLQHQKAQCQAALKAL